MTTKEKKNYKADYLMIDMNLGQKLNINMGQGLKKTPPNINPTMRVGIGHTIFCFFR